jgi:hypothetical protein
MFCVGKVIMEEIKGLVVKEFIEAAGDYCRLIENAGQKQTNELLYDLQQMLPLLYSKAVLIPKPKYCYEEEPKKFVSESDYAHIIDILQQKFEKFQHKAPDLTADKLSRQGTGNFLVAEVLADIYEELKNFIRLYETGISQAMNDAVWVCRNNFELSTGIMFIESLRFLHSVIYNSEPRLPSDQADDLLSQEQEDDEPWYSDSQDEIYSDDE